MITEYKDETEMGEAGSQWRGPGWYFWDETQSNAYGPYPTQAEAQVAEDRYADDLNLPDVIVGFKEFMMLITAAEKETQHAQPDEDDVQPIQPLQSVLGKTQPAQPIQFGKTQPPRKGINRALQNDLPI